MLTSIGEDLRYAARLLRRAPGFTTIAVLTLTLGIGGTTALFSVVSGVLLRPLPYRNPDRLTALWKTTPQGNQDKVRVTAGDYFSWRAESQAFDGMALFGAAGFTVTGDGEPEQLLGAAVSASYFDVLGVEPVVGRTFTADEERPGSNHVVILDHGLWQRRYGGRPDVVGTTLLLDDEPYVVVGIMPGGLYPMWPATTGQFRFGPPQQQFWVPLALPAAMKENRRTHVFGVIARLRPGVTPSSAQAELDVIARRLAAAYPAFNKDTGIRATPLVDELVGDVRPAILILFGAVALVLLIACANVANLLLARSSVRRHEIAVRAALGASRWRVTRQLLTESVLLALFGGCLGTVLGQLALRTLLGLMPAGLPRVDDIGLAPDVLGFALVASLLAAAGFGLIPALDTAKPNLVRSLRESGRGSTSGSPRVRLRQALVVVDVALAVVLIVGAGLLVRSFRQLGAVDPGFNPKNVLTLEMSLPQSKYSERQQVSAFYTEVTNRLRGLPGVHSVAIGYDHPLDAGWLDSFLIEGRPRDEAEDRPSAWMRIVSADYFETLGIGLIKGRTFSEQDDTAHPGVVIVNQAFADQYFPVQDPFGEHLDIATPRNIWGEAVPRSFEVAGIVRNVRFLGLDHPPEPAFYLTSSQFPQSPMHVFVRTDLDPSVMVPTVRSVVWDLDPDLPVGSATTLQRLLDQQLARPQFNLLLFTLFGIVAVTLAAVGLYGLLSFVVAQRTQEIGVRMALGAEVGHILRLVLAQGLALAAVGLAAGLGAALAAARVMASLLFGVSPFDAATFAFSGLLLLGVAVAACYLPAWRATRIDPQTALRLG